MEDRLKEAPIGLEIMVGAPPACRVIFSPASDLQRSDSLSTEIDRPMIMARTEDGENKENSNFDSRVSAALPKLIAEVFSGVKGRQKKGLQPIVLEKIISSSDAAKLRGFQRCENIGIMYKQGDAVMPSCHSGTRILFAQHRETGQRVVLKIRNKRSSFAHKLEEAKWRHSMEFLQNLPQSAEISAILDLFEDQNNYYVVMEKVPGQDLYETLRHGSLSPEEVKEVVKQLLMAINQLHSRNRIHKDIKLENVMFQRATLPPVSGSMSGKGAEHRNSRVSIKLLDFDTVDSFDLRAAHKAEDVLGTDQYIAQEAYAGIYSPASDVFAVGVIAYRLLAGKFPFRWSIFNDQHGDNWVGSPSMNEIRRNLLKQSIDWSLYSFTSDSRAHDLVKKMLSNDSNDRPTITEALDDPWFQDVQQRPQRRAASVMVCL